MAQDTETGTAGGTMYQDVFMRDWWGDDGTEPVTNADVAASPDAIPRGANASDQLSSEQLISSYSNQINMSLPVAFDTPNRIYVRAKNNHPGQYPAWSPSNPPKIYLRHSIGTLLTNVSSWRNSKVLNANGLDYAVLNPQNQGDICAGDQPFMYTVQPSDTGHFCFVATVDTPTNPEPIPTTDFTSWDQWVQWVKDHANLVWHNVDVVYNVPTIYNTKLAFQNFNATSTSYGFQIDYYVPQGSTITCWADANAAAGFSGFSQTQQAVGTPGPQGYVTSSFITGGQFPGSYLTTIYASVQWPAGKGPTDAWVTITSLGVSAPAEMPHLADVMRPVESFEPELQSQIAPLLAQSGRLAGSNGAVGASLVPITTFTTLFNPTNANTTTLAIGANRLRRR